MTTRTTLGGIFSSFLASVTGYPASRAEILALVNATASSDPTPQQIEVCLALLGGWAASGLEIPRAPRAFGADDLGEHYDTPIEWRYLTHSLNLVNGGTVSVIVNFFRKAFGTAATSPDASPLERQIYSTSIGVTLQLPGAQTVHYALPTTTFAPLTGGVEIATAPFRMVVGKNALTGGDAVFPLHAHYESDADPTIGRPALTIDVDSAATNPSFLQGLDGYVGAVTQPGQFPPVGWYYYSWPQQAATGSVSVDGTVYEVASGLTWMDHQWGGYSVPSNGEWPGWSGWMWTEFQFEGNRSLSLMCGHEALVDHHIPQFVSPGFGTFVDSDGTATLLSAFGEVFGYTQSPNTDAQYPNDWWFEVGTKTGPIYLVAKPVEVVRDQSLWMGSLQEYSESSVTVIAAGIVGGKPVALSGVGYCEGVSFETPSESEARMIAFLKG
jgi:predicted secreted hydrolase